MGVPRDDFTKIFDDLANLHNFKLSFLSKWKEHKGKNNREHKENSTRKMLKENPLEALNWLYDLGYVEHEDKVFQ